MRSLSFWRKLLQMRYWSSITGGSSQKGIGTGAAGQSLYLMVDGKIDYVDSDRDRASEGKVNLDDLSQSICLMEGSGYQGVTIRHLLMMRSGVDWVEIYRFKEPTQLTEVHDNSLVAYKYRWCDYAAKQSKSKNTPGTVFNYSTLDTSVLGCLLERVVGMKGADYMSEKLWKPAGMGSDGYWIMDGPPGRSRILCGFNALRDYGCFAS
jgi:hypothetical protein